MPARPRLLFVTDLAYVAKGRRYGDEDVFLASQLRDRFVTALAHPLDAIDLMAEFDLVLVRNSGPVLHYAERYEAFKRRALEDGVRVYNPLTGRGDMAGKQYLVDLTVAGYPAIPTVDRAEHLERLPESPRYVAKPKVGADSIGLQFLTPDEAAALAGDELLIQPAIDFQYEVSFYFIDHEFQYALNAPDPKRRWELQPYVPDAADLKFAQRFIDWNTLECGIQRVDACRTQEGTLLLVELEDLNPYLSLDLLAPQTRAAFVDNLSASLLTMLRADS